MKKCFCSIAVMLLCAASFAQTVPAFKDGDRVVYIGDSITDGGHYHSYIWLFYATRFPYMNLKMYNGGIGGDVAYQMLKRLDGDILAKNPSYITLTFGMNDTGYLEYKQPGAEEFGERRFEESMKSYRQIVDRLASLDNVNVAMIGGSPYDDITCTQGNSGPLPGKNRFMQKIGDEQKKDADARGWGFVDFNKPMLEIAARQHETDSMFTFTGGDRVHPDNAGHMVMAYLFLKAQGMSGSKVAGISLDGRKGNLLRAENCEITNLARHSRELTFDYLAESLPFPMDTIPHGDGKAQAAAAELVPFMEEMNQELLKVSGLSGKWKLSIDGTEIGVWDGKEYAEGINLAGISWTPQYRQALEIMHLNEFRWEMEQNMRIFAWMQFDILAENGVIDVDSRRAIEKMDELKSGNGWIGWHRPTFTRYMHKSVREIRWKQMEMLSDCMYELNKPVVRRVSIKKI